MCVCVARSQECVYLALRSVCLFLDEGVSLSVCVRLVCLYLIICVCVSQYVCSSMCFFLSLSVCVSQSVCLSHCEVVFFLACVCVSLCLYVFVS